MIKDYLPRSLFGRSLLIIVTPLCVVQIVVALVFFENHWQTLSQRLARNLAGDIGLLVESVATLHNDADRNWILRRAPYHMGIFATLEMGAVLQETRDESNSSQERELTRALREQVAWPFRVDGRSLSDHVIVDVQMADGVLHLVTSRKRVFSSTTYVFVLWMVGTSAILLLVAGIFMRNQVKPIARLARAAEDFGKGRDTPGFKPEGAREVRQAASAFIAMRDRILRQIGQRTAMLAGVSHDLRTPLTRMKLQLEMMGDDHGKAELKEDVHEMEQMLNGYLTFVRGIGPEAPSLTDLNALLADVVRQARRTGDANLQVEGELVVTIRRLAFQRIIANLVDNALRFGSHVQVAARRDGDAIQVTVEDDGPGIPAEQREEVFKPFFRLEGSRNPETGGIGLGLTIARDLARSHGGDVVLLDSPLGGLRAQIRLPV